MRRVGQLERPVVVDLAQPEPSVLLRDVHAERPEACESVEHRLRDAGVALDLERVHLVGQEQLQPAQESLAFLYVLWPRLRVRVNEIEAQAPQEELFRKARQRPFALACLLRDLT